MLKIFQKVALLEAISTVLLFFVAMPLKYFADMPMAVRIAGTVHGVLVVAFVILLVLCWQEFKWSLGRVIKYFILSLIPIVSFWVEIDLKKEIRRQGLV
ncbi:MAG TPA: DUF3817 domain-containing protein [Sphingobacterium sp.]|nr:DUF3817 domain-containing protein [Sphingobacterium sp.]